MRGRKLTRSVARATEKRQLLRWLLLTAVPMAALTANAETPTGHSSLVMPPLPLNDAPVSGATSLKLNPFCQPAPVAAEAASQQTSQRIATDIRLASGNAFETQASGPAATSIRLLPMPTSNADQAGMIRPNPLVIKQPLEAVVELTGANHSAAEDVDAGQPATATPSAVTMASNQSEIAKKPEVAAPTVTQSGGSLPMVEGPVAFSLTDEALVETSKQPKVAAAKSPSFAAILRGDAPEPVKKPAIKPVVIEPVEGAAPKTAKPAWPRPHDQSSSLAKGTASAKTLLVPLPANDQSAPVSSPKVKDNRIVKGGRPRVDVGVLPVAIERTGSQAATGMAAVSQAAPVMRVATQTEMAFQTDSPIFIDMKRADVCSLKFETEVSKVQLANNTVCSTIAVGPKQLQVIGTKDGVTRLAVWRAGEGATEVKEVYEIRVGGVGQSEMGDANLTANTLTRSAKTAFPSSSVSVRHESGKMVVEGSCPDQDTAKQVLRMVRSTCLLPVVDKLTIR